MSLEKIKGYLKEFALNFKKDPLYFVFFAVYTVILYLHVSSTASHNAFVETCTDVGYVPLQNGTCMPSEEYAFLLNQSILMGKDNSLAYLENNRYEGEAYG